MAFYKKESLYKTLKELGIIPRDGLDEAFRAAEAQDIPFDEMLTKRDLISDSNLGKIIADMISTPFVVLKDTAIDEDTLHLIPEIVAKKQKVISFKKNKDGLHLAVSDPSNNEIQQFIGKKAGLPVVVYYATERDIEDALNLYQKDVKEAFDAIIAKNIEKAKGVKKAEPSIIRIVETTINYAYQNKASDVHIEPFEKHSLVRFRIDGILHDVVELPKELHPQIVTRVKVLAQLRTDEHSAAQDGKLTYKTENESLDVRVSIVPLTDGEKIVMRILSERSRQFSLKDLGFSDDDLKKVKDAYEEPHGMILSTGPTGSGKTTTLYAVLKLLNSRDVNIMTIEDPVEYDIEGVNQIQVNEKTKLTFSKGLRSIVRQDPDIILVGEIRDEETADISINAAMTGHLVLSTLHTNDAATAVPRLLDFGVEPFLVGSTVNVIIAQRLVRKICESCKFSTEIDLNSLGKDKDGKTLGVSSALLKKYFGESGNQRVYQGKGCQVCHNTGYSGRIGIFEVLIVNKEIREAVSARKDASEIQKIAVENGMVTMLENGMEKVRQAQTTIEEILRVTKE